MEESQQLEMSCPSTQLRTLASNRLLWTDFTEAVKDWPTPTGIPIGRGEGWVSAKRGRGPSPEHKKDQPTQGKENNVGEQGTLNLNLSPDKDMTTEFLRGRGVDDTRKNTYALNMFGGKGAGRGTARAMRPPEVQPRYHTSVSYLPQTHMLQCM